ncbi:S41 family peptidase [Alteromonas sp. W364]|uniref:S41 family peptidase n=1 Tax=Alteromonas sp. W364 TaxID=3075610 RepID=UPI0028849C60|nr:S41 family peptidase [Alteromonas sp. W364]MDT0626806.1 S41 family peptidase [Alteromonas sp. W364]
MFLNHKLKTLHSFLFTCCAVALSLSANAAQNNATSYQQLGYFQAPSIHVGEGQSGTSTSMVFAAEGDLWRLSAGAFAGQNTALRITTHSAEERFPHVSPDGKSIAFSANYDGATEVYIIGISGGQAKRITFESTRAYVQGWTSEGKVLYSTSSTVMGPANSWVLKTVDPSTLKQSTIPVADAIEGVIDADGSYVYFVQHGLQSSGDNANQYKGGARGELWRFALGENKEAVKLTEEHSGSVRNPMLFKEHLYFVSNASGIDNIWRMQLDGTNLEQVTRYTDWGVRQADMHQGRIAYQLGADILVLDLLNNSSEKLNIQLTSDFPNLRDKWLERPLENLNSVTLAPKKDKVAITARGRIAVATTNVSRLIELNTDPSSRSRDAILSKDGKTVYAFNDTSGQNEIWAFSVDGKTPAKQLTDDAKVGRRNMWLSPDGTKIAHDTKRGLLYLLDLSDGSNKVVLSNLASGINDFNWSRDSQHFVAAYQESGTERSSIFLHSLAEARTERLTSTKYESYSPAFGAKGDWLYFISDRNFNADPSGPWGDRNMGPGFDRRGEIYAIALNEKAVFPFAEPTEELFGESDDSAAEDKDTESAGTETNEAETDESGLQIDWTGLAGRLWKVPVSAGNFSQLSVNSRHLYVIDEISEPGARQSLKSLSLEFDARPRTFTSSVRSYALSADGQSMLIVKGRGASTNMYIVPANSSFPNNPSDNRVQTSSWKLKISPQDEWRQMFKDAWLMHRDSLFDANMRGIDWLATKQKYEPLLARLSDRRELNDIFKQMMGELNALHSQVRGGDFNDNDEVPNASVLGAAYEDTAAGVVISHLYQHDPELPGDAAPLSRPGVDARVGDVIKEVNNRPVNNIAELVVALTHQANKQVLLTLERDGELLNTIVKPDASRSESRYRYRNWVFSNAQKVTEAENDIGYLHLYSMTRSDLSSFAKEFYAQYQKQGLIIDVRRNRGGNIDSIIIEKLLRRSWSFWQDTNGERSTNMQQAFRGHLVVLADEFTYSDGETFTAGIKALDLGTVIGKQTAGAGVWLSGGNNVVDGGIARAAEFPVYSMDGRWITEGRGISPDIEVNNLPHATFNGEDAQLAAAIAYLKSKIAEQPVMPIEAKSLPPVNETADDIE